MRWGESGVGCEFYDWAKNDPSMYRFWFDDREAYRESQFEKVFGLTRMRRIT